MFQKLLFRRIAAMLLDLAIIVGYIVIFVFLDGVFGLPEILDLLFGIIAILFILLYVPVQEAKYGQTIGKRVLHLRVVKENGNRLNRTDAFFRYYIRLVTSLTTVVSLVSIIQRGQSITDLSCETKVIEE